MVNSFEKHVLPSGGSLIKSYELGKYILSNEKIFSSERYNHLIPNSPTTKRMLQDWSLFGPREKSKELRSSLVSRLHKIELPELVITNDAHNVYKQVVLPYAIEIIEMLIKEEDVSVMWSEIEQISNYLFSMPASEQTMNKATQSILKISTLLEKKNYSEFKIHETILLLVGSFLLPTAISACWYYFTKLPKKEYSLEELKYIASESIRLFSPSRIASRILVDDHEIKGVNFSKGETVVVMLSMANRDEAIFKKPDEFQFGRKVRPLSFGVGPRSCIGESITISACVHFLRKVQNQNFISEISLDTIELPGIHYIKSIKTL